MKTHIQNSRWKLKSNRIIVTRAPDKLLLLILWVNVVKLCVLISSESILKYLFIISLKTQSKLEKSERHEHIFFSRLTFCVPGAEYILNKLKTNIEKYWNIKLSLRSAAQKGSIEIIFWTILKKCY